MSAKRTVAVVCAAVFILALPSCSKRAGLSVSSGTGSGVIPASSEASFVSSSLSVSSVFSSALQSGAVSAGTGKTSAVSRAAVKKTSSAPRNDKLPVSVAGMMKTSEGFGKYTVDVYSKFDGYESLVDRATTGGQPAYNYSVNLIRLSNGSYRAYFGARWKSSVGDGDHVLLYQSASGNGGTWSAYGPQPLFNQGREDGVKNAWYSGNVLEPEPMLAADGKWIMYTQVSIDKGKAVDTGEISQTGGDRIMLLTSPDGVNNWTRKTDRGVVVNIPDPATAFLHHEEVVYVPWDKEKRCYWLYFYYAQNNNDQGYYLIRSSDYTTFDFNRREKTDGFAQIGNQIGYMKEAPGSPLFTRITFTDDGSGRLVPALQFSDDGLYWELCNTMQGSGDNNLNKNCYFLGISTLNGQGPIEYLGNNTWRAKYAATTCNSSEAPEIFNSRIGVGTVIIHLMQYSN